MEEALEEEIKLTLKSKKNLNSLKRGTQPSRLQYPLTWARINDHQAINMILFQIMPFYRMLFEKDSICHCVL